MTRYGHLFGGRVGMANRVIGILLCVSVAAAEEDRKAALEVKAGEILKKTDVDRRKEVDVLFELGDIYYEEKDFAGALRLWEEGLRVDNLNLDYQIRHAELLLKSNRTAEALEKLNIVYGYAEEAPLINRAQSLLAEQGATVSVPPLEDPDTLTGPILYIVSFGSRNDTVLQEIATALAKILTLNVVVKDTAPIELGDFDRRTSEKYLQRLAAFIKDNLESQELQRRLRLAGISSIETASYKGLKVFVWSCLKEYFSDEHFISFTETLEQLEKEGQYNVERLREQIQRHYRLSGNVVGYLGITDADIYGSDTNFLFGSGSSGYAIMSYHRFGGVFNEMSQNRPLLVKRAVKQAVSSSFFILNIRRCTTPMCIRAYPHSLNEHDAKQDTLCVWCKEQLEKRLQK